MLKKSLVVALALTIVTGFWSCSDDEPVEEPVQASGTDEPAAMEDVPPPEPAPTFVAETVFFAFDDYTLNMGAQDKLNALADHMRATNGAVVQVEGHCDERGSIEYNLALGERRAQSVKNYLVQLGVDPARLTTISYGEERPSMDGHDEGAWSKNRRAEFTISTQ